MICNISQSFMHARIALSFCVAVTAFSIKSFILQSRIAKVFAANKKY